MKIRVTTVSGHYDFVDAIDAREQGEFLVIRNSSTHPIAGFRTSEVRRWRVIDPAEPAAAEEVLPSAAVTQ
jgi:hypothetical protein